MSGSIETARRFLSLVFPEMEGGRISIFELPSRRSRLFADVAGAADYCGTRAGEENIYFSVGLHSDHSGGGRGGEEHIVAIPGVWADIDIQGPAHKAMNLPASVEDAKQILANLQIKPTLLVHSGYGLQAYWLFKELWLLDSAEERAKAKSLSVRWQAMLRRVANAKGWALDSTADLARVLRVPGTLNHKLAPLRLPAVRFRQDGDRVDLTEIEDLVFDIPDDEIDRPQKKEEKDSGEPAALPPIFDGCAWMKHCRDDAAGLPEPEWYQLLTVIGRCHEAEKHAHELSKPYPKYSERETREKLQQAIQKAPGPVTCRFVELNFSGGRYCTNCSFQGQIKSPIQIGRGASASPRTPHPEGRSRVTDPAVFSIEKAIAERDTAAIYEMAADLAALDAAEWELLRDKLIRAFGKEIRIRDLDRAVKAHRLKARRRIDSTLPSIFCTNRPLRDLGREALEALVAKNAPPALFTRSGEMVRVAKDEKERPIIQKIAEPSLRHAMTLSANYLKSTESGDKHVSPPADIVQDVLALPPEQWAFPGLVAIVEAPTLRADGTILDQPGYDPASGMYFAPSAGLAQLDVPTDPTVDDVDAAVALVDEAIGDFPFLSAAAKANYFGLLLTPILRPALRSCTPLAVIDAPKAGTGKSLLVDVFSAIATGRPAAMTPYPRDDEEMTKQIGATLLAGRAIVCFDNVEGMLASPALALALTAKEYETRILGMSENMLVPNHTTWVVTGNNVRPSGDLPRRIYHIRLDARMSNPERGRQFRHPDLLGWIAENRAALLRALLTIARYWFACGAKPLVEKPLGSFEAWHRTIGSILQQAGVEGFLSDFDTFMAESDEVANQWENFLLVLSDHFRNGKVFRVAEVVTSAEQSEPLRDALPDSLAHARGKSPEAFRVALGQAFAKRRETRLGDRGVYLCREEGDVHKKVAMWSVRIADEEELKV